MDEFEFRNQYIDDEKTTEEMQPPKKEDEMNEEPSNEEYEEFYDSDKNSSSNNKGKTVILIVLIVLAVLLSSLAVYAGYVLVHNDRAPVVVKSHIESDNFDDHTVAKYGSMITLTFTFDKDLKNPPTVIILGRKVEVFGEGKEYYAKYFVQDQKAEKQVVTFSIQDFEDEFNKKGKPVTTTTDLSTVIILPIS